MKLVYNSNATLIETFNKQSQHLGRANSLYFEGETLYSYGYHYPLAYILKGGAVLINDRGWSNTTAKHIRLAIDKTDNRKQLLTSQIELGQVHDELKYLNDRLNRARKPERYAKAIDSLYLKFHENMAFLGGFYVYSKSPFSGVRFDLVYYSDANQKQNELLFNMNSYLQNALNFLS